MTPGRSPGQQTLPPRVGRREKGAARPAPDGLPVVEPLPLAALQGHVATDLGAGAVGAAALRQGLQISQHPRRARRPAGPIARNRQGGIEVGSVVSGDS